MINFANNKKNVIIMLTSLAVSACMIITSLACGNVAYGAEAPAGDDNFNYNGYSATQLKKISECISGVVPESECPSYEASSKDYYAGAGGTVNHVNMPTGVISTKSGWLKWADAAMKANSYDGVYGTLRISDVTGGSTSSSTDNEVSDVRFRLIGINQDNRADGTGKAGLTFQAIGYYNNESFMNTVHSTAGGWRDSQLRKNLNDESTGTIWNAIQSTDFKSNITPVSKITVNTNKANKNSLPTNNTSSTADKLYILSPSEMGMPIIKNYNGIISYNNANQSDANVHYYDSDSYNSTIKSVNDGIFNRRASWIALFNYIYAGNTYQWWMLPAGSRMMSNGSQAYHNTDLVSYCNLDHPAHYNSCSYNINWWLRVFYFYEDFSSFNGAYGFKYMGAYDPWYGVILAFSF